MRDPLAPTLTFPSRASDFSADVMQINVHFLSAIVFAMAPAFFQQFWVRMLRA
jgi:hypothetical protein